MSEKRRDKRGRILHTGETQMPDGRYRFRYIDAIGERRTVYSVRLDKNDPTPMGTKRTESLREMESRIQRDLFDHIVTSDGSMTVLELVEQYISTKITVRRTTLKGYNTVLNVLKKEQFARLRIDSVKVSDAKKWLIKLQKKDGRSYSAIQSIRGVLRPAFQMAVDDDILRKNPFSFLLVDAIVDDSVRRDAVSREQERKFLKFVKEDPHYSKFYEGIYILFKTGLRISEFCGITLMDIDFNAHKLNIDHQLLYGGSAGDYIEETKTLNGVRVIPMNPDVEECFKSIVKNRKAPKIEPLIGGKTGFLYYNAQGRNLSAYHWEKLFDRIVKKYNSIYKTPMPKITPHVCRHTYCSNMAKSGMNPKTLQYLMGHSDISVTLNVYTHVQFDDVKEEVNKVYANGE